MLYVSIWGKDVMSERICLDVNNVVDFGRYRPLIISHKTGVFYTSQTGGLACHHPMEEGFLVPIDDKWIVVEDCKIGMCWEGYNGLYDEYQKAIRFHPDDAYLASIECARIEISHTIDNELKKVSDESYAHPASHTAMRLDFDRIHLLHEGWWPVIVNTNTFSDGWGTPVKEYKGILCGWNCD